MSHLQSFHGAGTIPRASGAAVAALEARAATWDVPLVEGGEGLSLLVWGGELRLNRQIDSPRVELRAPEQRLVGTLRDAATELLAEVGLTVQWDHVDVGALAPGLSLLRVERVGTPTPNFLRVRLRGPMRRPSARAACISGCSCRPGARAPQAKGVRHRAHATA